MCTVEKKAGIFRASQLRVGSSYFVRALEGLGCQTTLKMREFKGARFSNLNFAPPRQETVRRQACRLAVPAGPAGWQTNWQALCRLVQAGMEASLGPYIVKALAECI